MIIIIVNNSKIIAVDYIYIFLICIYYFNSLVDIHYIANILFQLFTFSFKMKLQLFAMCVMSFICASYAGDDICYSSVKSVCSSTGKFKCSSKLN